jgi:hypothetical protein
MPDDTARKLDQIDGHLKAIGLLMLLQHLPESKKTERERLLASAAVLLGIQRL